MKRESLERRRRCMKDSNSTQDVKRKKWRNERTNAKKKTERDLFICLFVRSQFLKTSHKQTNKQTHIHTHEYSSFTSSSPTSSSFIYAFYIDKYINSRLDGMDTQSVHHYYILHRQRGGKDESNLFLKIIIINSLFVFIYIRIYREESEFDQLEQPLSSILKRGWRRRRRRWRTNRHQSSQPLGKQLRIRRRDSRHLN